MSQVVVRRTEGRFTAAGGRSLYHRAWLPPEPKRALVIVHGFGEHSGRYEDMAAWFSQRGSALHAFDQQGHGLSTGRRGHAGCFDDLLDDVEALLELVAREHPGLSRVLIGHSMGGLVVSALACEREPAIDLLVTSGAALALSPDLSSVKIALARLLRRFAPRLAMEAGLDEEEISRDPLVVSRYREDPLVHGRVTSSLAAGMMDAIARTAASAAQVRVPMLLLHGDADRLCLPAGSQCFYAGLPHSEVAGSEIRTYPKLKHEIFNEPERETIFEDLLGWIQRREAERASHE